MRKSFGGTIREMREAQKLGLRAAADRLEISPAYLSRIERNKERPPRPELVKRMAKLLGGDSDLLFRLAASTDPDLAAYMHRVSGIPEFLRTAEAMNLTSEDFEVLIEDVKQRRPSETIPTRGNTAGRRHSRVQDAPGRVSPAGSRAEPERHRPGAVVAEVMPVQSGDQPSKRT